MCDLQATVVLREGKYHATAVERLVVGDIVSVKFGDRLPADIRIITSAGFKVNSRPNHPHIISVQWETPGGSMGSVSSIYVGRDIDVSKNTDTSSYFLAFSWYILSAGCWLLMWFE